MQCARGESVDDQQPERDPRYWFKTGNVVLVASRKTIYRVHSDILAQKSRVFHDLLECGIPPPADQESMDGCPVIHVSDEPQDFSVFLGLIYNTLEFFVGDELPEWSVVKIMVVLGDKYDAQGLHAEGVRRLKLFFPRDVSEWGEEAGFSFYDEDIVSIVNATRTLGTPELHAAALYLCSSQPITAILRGINGEEGVEALCPEDLRRCLYGRENMANTWFGLHTKLFSVFPLPEMQCLTPQKCPKAVESLRSAATRHALKYLTPDHAYDPVSEDSWERLWVKVEKYGLCLSCRKFYEARLLGIRQNFLDGLQERFTLPPEDSSDSE
ncbi:hypothetical protein NM688_g3528 [Phlebia brevispora]|uniref:Uncharacterized protein n=1 Tax=Phlebia brevispora TaxID=194682 RepID=A0ACC1T5P6_9APHY|nr:hypothetical protein NM688_g3528 [Phlebia brevispora]